MKKISILLTLLTILTAEISYVKANPAPEFTKYLPEIQSRISFGLVMRLPKKIQLDQSVKEPLIIKIFTSGTPANLTVGLFKCDVPQNSCFLGSFAVARKESPIVKQELLRHQTIGDKITLKQNIKGYLIEGKEQEPTYSFSSLMWQQEDMIYTITFPGKERQNILFMGYSMANNPICISRRGNIKC